jgi:pyridoxal phosphate enzyme (YggS family)
MHNHLHPAPQYWLQLLEKQAPMTDIAKHLDAVKAQIRELEQRYERPAGQTQLLAVSKTKPATMVRDAHRAGQNAFGENQLQDALGKLDDPSLASLDLDWHFIGPLQANKSRTVAERFAWIHSLDRLRVATRLNDQRPAHLPALNVCIQVNLSGESSKSGLDEAQLVEFAAQLAELPKLRLRGLMTIPAPCTHLQAQRVPFRRLRGLLEQLREQGHAVDTLSMGMSTDMEAAIAEGATWVRIGTAIFGQR